MTEAKKLMLIGLDSAIIDFFDRFGKEGRLPSITCLMQKGWTTETRSVMPVGTAENWRTIVTGSYADTHGVVAMNMPGPGDSLEKRHTSFFSTQVQAEFLWDAAERAGKKPLLLKYTGSWPPTIKQGIHVEGFGDPDWNVHEISPRLCFATYPLPTRIPYSTAPYWISQAHEIKLAKADGWANLPPQGIPPLEAVLRFIPRSYGTRGPNEHSGQEKTLYALVTGTPQEGYQRVSIAESRDYQAIAARMMVGQWSEWIRSGFQLPAGPVTGLFRMKLIELEPDGSKLKLYQSQIFPESGWTLPDSLAQELVREIGPYQELSGIIGPWLSYWVDEDTILEEMEYQADWLARAADYLLGKKQWDFFFTQWHGIDHMGHGFMGGIDPKSATYDPDRAELCWHITRRAYELADKIVGAIIEHASDDTLVVLTSDHGHLPVRAPLKMGLPMGAEDSYHNDDVNAHLARCGLLTFKDGPYGYPTIDWTKTKACVTRGNYVEINLKGRYPHGIVEPEDYEEVRTQVINALDSLTDPETGDKICCLVMKREEGGFIGMDHERVSDVVFFTKAEYSRPTANKLTGQRMLSGNHHFYLPDVKFDLGNMHAVTIFMGPGVREGIRRERPINMVDIAPTIAWILGIPAPAQAEGRVLRDLLLVTTQASEPQAAD